MSRRRGQRSPSRRSARKVWHPEKEGDVHPKCGTPVVRKAAMFALRGWQGDGLVCETCHALWVVPGEDTIFDVARRTVHDEP